MCVGTEEWKLQVQSFLLEYASMFLIFLYLWTNMLDFFSEIANMYRKLYRNHIAHGLVVQYHVIGILFDNTVNNFEQ